MGVGSGGLTKQRRKGVMRWGVWRRLLRRLLEGDNFELDFIRHAQLKAFQIETEIRGQVLKREF